MTSTRILLCAFFLLFIACASPVKKGETEAENLYNQALEYKNDKRYLLATETLNELKTKYSYSVFAVPAELMLADVEFAQENYIQAAALYRVFKDIHPKHKDIPYVLYQIGESHRLQLSKGVDRDISPLYHAIAAYREVVGNYRSSEYAEPATKRLEESFGKLQAKERYVADFYFRTKKYQSAKSRYLEILEKFNDQKLRIEAMERIVISSRKLGEFSECVSKAGDYLYLFEAEGWDAKGLSKEKSLCEEDLLKGEENES